MRADKYNLQGAFSDDASRASGSRTRHVAENHANFGQFKTPSLRTLTSQTFPEVNAVTPVCQPRK